MAFPEEKKPIKVEYVTPDYLYQAYNSVYRFDLDAAADEENHKTLFWFGPGGSVADGLSVDDWGYYGSRVWCNWPYGRKENPAWAMKCYEQSLSLGTEFVVGLCFGRYDTEWWADWVDGKAKMVHLISPRVKFVGEKHTAQVPSAVMIWNGSVECKTTYRLVYLPDPDRKTRRQVT